MRKGLQSLGLMLMVGIMFYWAASGAHPGWTRTSVPVRFIDDVTGIEGVTYQRQFVPGLDFLGAGLLGAVLLAAASFVFRKKQDNPILSP